MKREYEEKLKLQDALSAALTEAEEANEKLRAFSESDSMTGVKNKNAWLVKEKELNKGISEGNIEEFAVVVCDVNGLKKINDTYGHKAGDEYIQAACQMVCDIFQHSPVYRVGGDEFTIILSGRDYAIKEDLMTTLHDLSAAHITAGGAVVSGGLSDFVKGQDRSTHDVVQRADEKMYEEKQLLKSLGAVTRENEKDASQSDDVNALQSIIQVKRHVLIVEDEEVNRMMLGMALSSGYDLVYATDGYEALEQIRTHKDDLALILLDLLMPRLSGIDVLKTMKNDEDIRDIPVIVMTADQDAELECLNLGVMDFVPKPYPRWEIVRARVNKCIELAEDRDIIRATERDSLTSLFNIDYFRRYVQMFDQNDWDAPMDAVAVSVDNFQTIIKNHGKPCGDKVLRSIGERLRTLARELGGVGSRQGEDTFLIYCPHREDYPELLSRLSANLNVDEYSSEQVQLRMGVYPVVDKKLDIERRFENARVAAGAVGEAAGSPVGIFDADTQETKEV